MMAVTCLDPEVGKGSSGGQRSFFGFSLQDLLRFSKEPRVSLSLSMTDEVNNIRESPALCEHLHSPLMRAVLCAQVCKVYRFQTEDARCLLVKEQMSETPLSFSLPKQLLSVLISQLTNKLQEVEELGNLSPHWDGLRSDVISHCSHLIGSYEETLGQLHTLSVSSCFKSSGSKWDKHLQFVPTNLHSQVMQVTCQDRTGVWYHVITFGAPAEHHQAFKHGGLKRLLAKHTDHMHSFLCYSQEESSRARAVLASVAQLQPLLFGLAEELLSVSLEHSTARLQLVADNLTRQMEKFVHALNDELVRSSLMHIQNKYCHNKDDGLHDTSPEHQQYDEEEWDRVWANVTNSLSCIIAMVDRLKGRQDGNHPDSDCWQEQLLPLVVTLRDCVREAVQRARTAMTFVVLQAVASDTIAQGPAKLAQRRHAVFSQALSAATCGFLLRLHNGLEDSQFLQQLHTVGILVQFEGLLSTYGTHVHAYSSQSHVLMCTLCASGDEVGMLEDMMVAVADLGGVTFSLIEAKSEQPDDLQPTLQGTWGSLVAKVPLPKSTFMTLPDKLRAGCLIPLHPVLFNIGINQQQTVAERFGNTSLQERLNQESCEQLKVYCNTLRERVPDAAGVQSLWDKLASLSRSVETRRRKNVEVLWLAASICREVSGVRLTSCKSAKDRTAMSVTLEQCMLLKDKHALSPHHFSTALDHMRRCRLSWGQMLGCYAKSGLTPLGLALVEKPLDLQKSSFPRCFSPKGTRPHLYPVAVLLVTSHLLVLWLILSLLVLVAKYE
ncbi:type II inositol 3,4-bisphosphate 4-phosphatase-like isoform X3 [Dunckerocampus dactyliophorus]|uniref:type II inositol 3,4-bisphosphate 4-phosphatase-like isoform X3 n=2 Tax=Dunckerocampus dactyliophorus TaxID=161453 RepID=UPI0024065FAE|nr:type II inositol 3,4-bisphosphate 4-phosphatase-like isoform X3 [Dunckerocampus dactyliophorus]